MLYFLMCAGITKSTPNRWGSVEKVAHSHKGVIFSFITNTYSRVLTFLEKKVKNKEKKEFLFKVKVQ